MLRITTVEPEIEGRPVTLKLEGRLVGPWVDELRDVARDALSASRRLDLDLSGVRFVDAAGVELLRELHGEQAALRGAAGYVEELLRESLPRSAGHETAASLDPAEEELLRRLQEGDESAWESLVREATPRLLGCARRLLGDEHQAREAVRAAFATAFVSTGEVRGVSRLSTWLRRLLVVECRGAIRARGGRDRSRIGDLLPCFDREGRHIAVGGAPEQPSAAAVRSCVESLPLDHRIVFQLHDVEDLGAGEIAEILSLSRTAVHVRLHRARQGLRTLLADVRDRAIA